MGKKERGYEGFQNQDSKIIKPYNSRKIIHLKITFISPGKVLSEDVLK